jgi:hypothetical protein
MKVGIMQPYFFPYLGHFSLIASVDQWIVFDITQYTPKTWMNRNRILHPKTGWQYITVPLSNSSITIKTSEAKILNLAKAKKSILGKLSHLKKKAPYFSQVIKVVEDAFNHSLDDSLVNLNISALSATCKYLNIPFLYERCSTLDITYPPTLNPGEWAPFICNAIGASEYVNPISGKHIFDPLLFKQTGITLYFAEFAEFAYATAPYTYEPHLSILDVMMWNSPESIHAHLKKGTTLLKAS